tara:strand:- start:340 stop:948 length:609 start_codon:yes stop_codon:yes gene_type:complete
MNITLTVPSILEAMKRAGYVVFQNDSKPYNLNIVGVRATYPKANKFNDMICCFWKYEGYWNLMVSQITTLPGTKWMLDPMNKNGCAILVPGQYRSAYKLDLHAGKYLALCQRAGNVSVYRDDNKDYNYDYDPATIQTGMFGINIHRASAYTELENVGANSAGCQVFQDPAEYDVFIDVFKKSQEFWGDKFTYTLIEQKYFEV